MKRFLRLNHVQKKGEKYELSDEEYFIMELSSELVHQETVPKIAEELKIFAGYFAGYAM